MAHDVYVCYAEEDIEVAKDVCDSLESSGLRCWFKDRDSDVEDRVNKIMNAIKKSKVMVFIHSKNSKNSNFVNTEVDFAFSEKRSILVFHIDESKIEGGLEFILINPPNIKVYPNPKDHFERLNNDTKLLVEKQSKIDGSIGNIIKNYKIPIIIGIVVILLIVLVLGFTSLMGDTSPTVTKAGDIKLKITDFHADDVTKENTDWNYSYFVGGTISPSPSKQDGCRIVVDYYDKSGKLINTTETPFEEAQKVSVGFLFGSTVSNTNNVKVVDVQLVNKDNTVIAQDDSQI